MGIDSSTRAVRQRKAQQATIGEATEFLRSRNSTCPIAVLALFLLIGSAWAQPTREVAVREGYTTTSAGLRIHYLESGQSASTHALVLIPGWRLPAFLWNEQLVRFSSTIRVIAIDPRSQGASTKTSDGNTPESRARDLHDILKILGVSHAVLVGWSQGAQDVAAYVQQFGTASVDGVVFVDSPVSSGPAEIEIHRAFSQGILSGISMYASHPEEYSEGMVRSLFKKRHPNLDVQRIVRHTLQTPVATGIAMLVADIFGADRRSALTRIDKPTLVVGSSESPLIEVQKEMAATIPGSKFVLVEGSGHALFIDEPEKFDEALRAFLESLTR